MTVDFDKYPGGLVPAIVQDAVTDKVLMLGFMNREAMDKTYASGKVTFFSRSKNRLWTKGEESGNFLVLENVLVDCDSDTFLIKARPSGPVCHTSADTCFNEKNEGDFLKKLEAIIIERRKSQVGSSYTASLFSKGINAIAQKVGEEAVELIIEAKDDNPELFLGEAADLLFHYLVLLNAKGVDLSEVLSLLKSRHKDEPA